MYLSSGLRQSWFVMLLGPRKRLLVMKGVEVAGRSLLHSFAYTAASIPLSSTRLWCSPLARIRACSLSSSLRSSSAVPPPPVPDIPPDFLSLSDRELLDQCTMNTFRASGPGGQHRNKTESAVRLTHRPTGLVSQAADDRSQHRNRAYALDRLRNLIAIRVRRPISLDLYSPPPELLCILPAGKGKKGGSHKLGPNHPDFPKGLQCLLDLLVATEGSISATAMVLRTKLQSLLRTIDIL